MKKFLKVLLIIAVVIAAIIGIAFYATSGIATVAKKQLSLIHDGKVEEAYNTYTSKEFQAATNLEAFKLFVESRPAIKNFKSVSFSKREVTNGLGYLEGTLTGEDGSTAPIKFQLVKEGSDWKVQGIDMTSAGLKEEGTPVNGNTTTEIFGVAVSNDMNSEDFDKGQAKVDLDKSISTFKTEDKNLFVSVYIKNAQAGSKVAAALVYKPTSDMMGPAYNDLAQNGDAVSNFTISAPTNGWPKGDYLLKIQTSTGQSKDIDLKVE